MSTEITELVKRVTEIEKELKSHRDFIDTLMSYKNYQYPLFWMSQDAEWDRKKSKDHFPKDDRLKGKKSKI